MRKTDYIDMWHGDKTADATSITIFFSDCDCVYRGNIYIGGVAVGDYQCSDSLRLERWFSQLTFNWD